MPVDRRLSHECKKWDYTMTSYRFYRRVKWQRVLGYNDYFSDHSQINNKEISYMKRDEYGVPNENPVG